MDAKRASFASFTGHFENQILFLTVSQSPILEVLRSHIWAFLTSCTRQTRKLVILDDVWTRKSLDQLFFKTPGTTTLVVSRSKFADPKATHHVELLNEDEATSLFCLSAFDQKSIPSGFNIKLVKQVNASTTTHTLTSTTQILFCFDRLLRSVKVCLWH